jgi:DNA adenine methylase
LRYPGAKRRLASYIEACLKLNDLRPGLFVEPMAGGASVSLQLAQNDAVEKIMLGELDPDVAAFWRVAFFDHEWLCGQIERATVSVPAWNKHKRSTPEGDRERAFRCLFLNRTSFSGILSPTSGPIGGQKQESSHTIDCRWNASTLTQRIEQVARLKDKVEPPIMEAPWPETVAHAQSLREARDLFFYFDPPFYEQGTRLYRHAFDDEAHLALKQGIDKLQSNWILSYDPAPFIVSLYDGSVKRRRNAEFLYTTTGKKDELRKASELILTNLQRTPRATRLWRTNQEWTKDKSH